MATTSLGGLTVYNPYQTANTSTGAPANTMFSMHNAGQIAGHLLNALPGYSTLGSNITNPTVNYMGIPNPGYGATASPNAIDPSSTSQVLGDATYTDSAGNSYATQAQADAANQAIAQVNFNLGRLPGQLQTAQNQVQNAYNTNLNQLQSGYDQSKASYGQSTAQNGQQFVTNKNQIANMASNGIRSLLSILGAHGAGGSSAALYGAPNAVAQLASQQRSGAGQTFGQNQQALDTNWGQYQTGFDNSKKELSDWLGQQMNAAQSNSDAAKQGLLTQLAQLQTSPTNAQPYLDQINALSGQIDQLANFNPSYTGKSPVYNAPNVASYTVNQPGAPTLGTPGNNTSAAPTALSFLLGLKDKNQQQPAF